MQLCPVTWQLWKRALWVQSVTLGQENHRDVRAQLQVWNVPVVPAGRAGDSARSPHHPWVCISVKSPKQREESEPSQKKKKNQLFVLISRVSLPFPSLECLMVFFLPLWLSSWLQRRRKNECEREGVEKGDWIPWQGLSPALSRQSVMELLAVEVLWIQQCRAGIRECQGWNLCSHLLNNCSPLVMGERVENYFWPGGRVDFLA